GGEFNPDAGLPRPGAQVVQPAASQVGVDDVVGGHRPAGHAYGPLAIRSSSIENASSGWPSPVSIRRFNPSSLRVPARSGPFGAPAFVDGPDDQALAAAHVAGGEHARDARGELAVLRLGVRALVLDHAELFEDLTLRPEEAHRQKYELRRVELLGAGDFLGHEA